MLTRILASAALAIVVAATGCSAPRSSGTGQSVVPVASGRHALDTLGGTPRMQLEIAMFDAPLPQSAGAHVNLAITAVEAVANGVVETLAGANVPRTVDLLTLTHDALALHGTIPAGSYDAIRLLIDTAQSSVVVDGRRYPLVFAHSARRDQPSIVAIDADVAVDGSPGATVSVDVDFNVLQSISLRGSYAYVKPKIVAAHGSGRVIGAVVNGAGRPVSNATVIALDAGGNVANTTLTETDGTFILHALAPGRYTVRIVNRSTTDGGDIVSAGGVANVDADGPSVAVVLASSGTIDVGILQD